MSSSVHVMIPVVEPPLRTLDRAARQLEARGWCVHWDVSAVAGERDARLVVLNGAVVVELLVPVPGDCWWDAVRVKPASRVVWRGPQLECACDQLIRFAEDLLTCDVEQLPGRYQLLG